MIRRASPEDLSRIAEILVFDKRMHYRRIFHDDRYSFNTLQVLRVAGQYGAGQLLEQIFVYDDGIVKGLIRIQGTEIAELYVDFFFQRQGIGARLLRFARQESGADHLWALEGNTDALAFYARQGFLPTGEKKPEEGTDQFSILLKYSP